MVFGLIFLREPLSLMHAESSPISQLLREMLLLLRRLAAVAGSERRRSANECYDSMEMRVLGSL